MNIIWTEKELKEINKIILNKLNYELNEENIFVKKDNTQNFTDSKFSHNIYNTIIDEISELLYIEDKEKISNILLYLSNIKADYDNNLHYGLIVSLDQINPNNHTYIFKILKEIIAQYERVISTVAKETTKDMDSKQIEEKINDIKLAQEETFEEKQIKAIMSIILTYANKIKDINVFNRLIEKYNQNIKNRLIYVLTIILINTNKKEETEKRMDMKYHTEDFNRKYQKRNLGTLKRTYSKIF